MNINKILVSLLPNKLFYNEPIKPINFTISGFPSTQSFPPNIHIESIASGSCCPVIHSSLDDRINFDPVISWNWLKNVLITLSISHRGRCVKLIYPHLSSEMLSLILPH